jgi:type II secretory pathway component PulF
MPIASAANFCRRFGTGLRAGVDILRLLQNETKHGPAAQRAAMAQLHQAIRDGESLPTAMQNQDRYFPPLMIAMASAGETTGKLEQTLLTLAGYYDERIKIRREFFRQISWPMFQLFAAVNILALLIFLLGVLTPPTGGEMFDPTGFGLRGAGGVMWFYSYVLVVAGAILGCVVAFQNNFVGIHNLIPLLYRIPVAGTALQTITLSRFTWTLALSLDAGIDPIRAIHLGLDSTDSDFYRSGKDDVVRSIRGGGTMSEALLATGIFPDDFITAVEVAEISGTDAEAMHHLAADYDQRAKSAMQTLSTIASRGIGVGVMILMVFLILRMAMRIMGGIQDAIQPI